MRWLALVVAVAAVSSGCDRGDPERDRVRARLRSGPFDEDLDIDQLLDVFNTQGHDHASSLFAGKFLRVKARYYDATPDKDGNLLVVVGGWRGNDAGAMCAYIGDNALVHAMQRNQTIRMHAHGAVDVKGVVTLVDCVIEPPS